MTGETVLLSGWVVLVETREFFVEIKEAFVEVKDAFVEVKCWLSSSSEGLRGGVISVRLCILSGGTTL